MSTLSIMALDVGAKRVGVAVTSLATRLPRPLITMQYSDEFFDALRSLVEVEQVVALVVGFPRGMQGQHTQQTTAIETFTKQLRENFALPIYHQDEALTSKHAETELQARGRDYDKGDIDALAATYILQDFLTEHSTHELQALESHGVL